ncbi:uncharacterized mitochondrial protein AtMg00820-like [Aristolochia californica]|uniref:uncharacterized mitochondrial protein AtMg00820-like n=1 Tax=Aristolochia californica TaxID=171875 RepID=UPI0035DDA397
MDEEMQALNENQTWVLVLLPSDEKFAGCKSVFTVKHNPDVSVSCFKARLVAKGYMQCYGINYEETFSLVAKMNSVYQFDVKKDFLIGDIKEEIYMQ